MLRRINKLFQKMPVIKVENKSNSCGQEMPEIGAQKHVRQNQYGRTMTEMLGVLAIMGILSIGAIAGYRYGMDKYRAGETAHDINLRMSDLMIQQTKNQPLSLEEWDAKGHAGYPMQLVTDAATDEVYLSVEELPARVCEMVIELLASQSFGVEDVIDGTSDAMLCQGEKNGILIALKDGHGCEGILGEDGTCTPCPDGMSWDSATKTCECSGNQYYDGSACIECRCGSVVNADKTSCECPDGAVWQKNYNICTKGANLIGGCTCREGEWFTYEYGVQWCRPCPAGSTGVGGICTCPDGQFFNPGCDGFGSCQVCPSGSTSDGAGGCTCPAGQEWVTNRCCVIGGRCPPGPCFGNQDL